jgi:hypothetical protein
MKGSPAPECGVCGGTVRPAFRAPQPEIAPDLDMRPGEPARSTLVDWIQTCRHCGAAAPDLTTLTPGARGAIESPDYKALATSVLEETLPFRRWAMICANTGDDANHAEGLLQAAWAADDAAAMTEASRLREQVATLWDGSVDIEIGLRRLDVLRRAGAFAAAEAWAETLGARTREETAAAIIRFQRGRIALRDVGRHLISSAMPPPSHAPHVSHGKRATTGFWSRLLRK